MRKFTPRPLNYSLLHLLERLESRLLLAATPYTSDGQPWPITVDGLNRIEAENFDNGGEGVAYHDTSTNNDGGKYRTSERVDIEYLNGNSSKFDVGWINKDEWLGYTINVAVAGTYQLQFHACSVGSTGGTAHVLFNGVNKSGTITVTNTAGAYQDFLANVTLSAGTQFMQVWFDSNGMNLDSLALRGPNWTPPQPVAHTGDAQPWPISTTSITWIEAENYDDGGEGVAYHDTTTGNSGNYSRTTEDVDTYAPVTQTDNTSYIGNIAANEWVTYTVNVAQAGQYELRLRESSYARTGTDPNYVYPDAQAQVYDNGADLTGVMTITNTQTANTNVYASYNTTVTLTAGKHVLKVLFLTGSQNLDYISLQPLAAANGEHAYSTVRDLPPVVPTWGAQTVEAENYNTGGQDVAYHKVTINQNTHATYNPNNLTPAPQFRTSDYVSTANLAYSTTKLSVTKWETGDWTDYNVIATTAGVYEMLLSYAIGNTTNAVYSVSVNGVTQGSNITLTPTGDWNLSQNYKDAPIAVQLAAGTNVIRITNVSGTANIDNFTLSHATTYGNNGYTWYLNQTGSPVTHIQAVNFDLDPDASYVPAPTSGGPAAGYRTSDLAKNVIVPSTGVYIETTTDPGSGTGAGYSIGQIQANQYMDYTIRPELIGRYNLLLRIASNTTGGSFRVLFDGVDRTGLITVPNTGSTQAWQTITLSIMIENPIQSMRIQAVGGGWGLNWIELDKDTTTDAVLATASPNSSTGSGSYAAEPPDAALNSVSDLFDRVVDKQYDWINKPADAPVPTNDWWTNLLESTFAGGMWPYPQKISTDASGVTVTSYNSISVTTGNVSPANPKTIKVSGTSDTFTRDALLDYGDWTVHFRMQEAGSNYMDVTMGRGIPYTWFEFNGMTPTLNVGGTFTAYNSTGTTLGSTFTTDRFRIDSGGEQFGIFAPAGTTFTLNGSTYTVTFTGASKYIVIGILPDSTNSTLDLYYQHAYAIPRQTVDGSGNTVLSSTYGWTYSAPQGQVGTTWNLNTVALKTGANLDTIQGWLPHNYREIISGPTLVGGYQYPTINGPVKVSVGRSFTIVQPANGLAAVLPTPAAIGGTADYNSAIMAEYLTDYANQYAANNVHGGDTYWGGKDLQMYAEYALMAQQLKDPNYQAFVNALDVSLTDWFTYTPGETEHYFAYYQKDKALIGFDPAYGSSNYTDNHFHYGYHISAAGVLGLLDPAWLAQYGAMATMVAKQYANWDRADQRFPFLRTFECWSGHSYAGGTGDTRGNNQESTSEAMQSWQGLVILGQALNDPLMTAVGMMGYTIEAKAMEEYWFDVHGDLFKNQGFGRSNVAINYDDSKSTATFFSGAAECTFGIENLPLWPSMEFNGRYPSSAAASTAALIPVIATQKNNPSIVDFHTWALVDSGSDWVNIALGYVSQYDAQFASNEITTNYNLGLGVGTDSHTGIYYYQAEAHRTHGQRDWTSHLSLPLGGVYANTTLGSKTYIVYNPSSTAQTVYVYDQNNNVIDSFTAKAHDTTTVVRGTVVPAIVMNPNVSSLAAGDTQQFSVVVVDQAGNPLANQPTVTWSLASGSVGTISSTGVYTSPSTALGNATVQAYTGTLSKAISFYVAPEPNYATGFTPGDTAFSLNGGATLTADGKLHLTDNTGGQKRSAFYQLKLDVTHFVTSFNFVNTGGANMSDGMTFTIQNSAVDALSANSGSTLGYQGIGKSIAIKFDMYNNGKASLTGMLTNGASPDTVNIDMSGAGVTIYDGHTYNAVVSYDGSNLTLTVMDVSDRSKCFTYTWQGVDIPSLVGANTAWAGFTAATGGYSASQDITAWTWDKPVMQISPATNAVYNGAKQQFSVTYIDESGVAVVNPSGLVWSLDSGSIGTITSGGLYEAAFNAMGTATVRATMGGVSTAVTLKVTSDPNYYNVFDSSNLTLTTSGTSTLPTVTGGVLRLTDNTGGVRSAFYGTKVDITSFVTNFSFQITGDKGADGFTFTIQNQASNALGGINGDLAYKGITKSLAIKFDIYKDTGETTNNTTGLFTNGASPIGASSIDLTPSGVQLNSGRVFNVAVAYDGANLTLTITDSTNSSKTFTKTWTGVDIPTLVGASKAWVGFTAACGGYHATQDILKWTWNKPTTYMPVVSPNPRTNGVASATIVFNRPITGFDRNDLVLTRDGGSNLITSGTTVTTTDNITYTIGGNLASLTAYAGTYSLSFNTAGNVDVWGNAIGGALVNTWVNNAISVTSGDTVRVGKNATSGLVEVFINNGTTTPTYSVNAASFSSLVLSGSANFSLIADLANVPLTVSTGTTVTAMTGQHLGTLSVTGSGKLVMAVGGDKTLYVTGLALDAGARLDLNDNDLQWTSANLSSDYATLRGYLAAGRNAGSWNGTGLISGVAHTQYVAYGNEYTSLGMGMAGNTLRVKYTYAGDADLSGAIDFDDYLIVDWAYLFDGGTGWENGDFDYSGSIGVGDYVLMDRNFGRQNGALDQGLVAMHSEWFGAGYMETAMPMPVEVVEPVVTEPVVETPVVTEPVVVTPVLPVEVPVPVVTLPVVKPVEKVTEKSHGKAEVSLQERLWSAFNTEHEKQEEEMMGRPQGAKRGVGLTVQRVEMPKVRKQN